MSGESLVVTILTAHRLDYAVRTAAALAEHLQHDGPVTWVVADDGDDDNYVGQVSDAIRQRRGGDYVYTTQAGGRGYGASFNTSTQLSHALGTLMMPVEDDWELTRPLDTAPLIRLLGARGYDEDEAKVPPPADAMSVRLGYLGFRWALRGDLFQFGPDTWLMLDPTSPEQNVQAGHPRLETVDYQRLVGPWTEGLPPGATELEWVQREKARYGVVWPLGLVRPWGDLFAHIGGTPSWVQT